MVKIKQAEFFKTHFNWGLKYTFLHLHRISLVCYSFRLISPFELKKAWGSHTKGMVRDLSIHSSL